MELEKSRVYLLLLIRFAMRLRHLTSSSIRNDGDNLSSGHGCKVGDKYGRFNLKFNYNLKLITNTFFFLYHSFSLG